ncbi:MAG: SDR family NAD(P)-dependent oxidoreductase, partial [Pseudomonadales bacterium]|nr:SDR family NAD(P)-dependent oxidoreductase [Pseudomonadales bacterium]
FEQIELTEHRRTFDINVMGLMNVCHAAFPFLKETKGAKIINMSSASALYGVPHLASYSASKFAVRGLTEALNIEWQKFDIHVCDVMPPFVNTPMVTEQEVTPAVVKRLGVNLDPDDVANAAWTAMNNQAVHFPVGLQFASLMRMSKVLPAKATRLMMDVLSR